MLLKLNNIALLKHMPKFCVLLPIKLHTSYPFGVAFSPSLVSICIAMFRKQPKLSNLLRTVCAFLITCTQSSIVILKYIYCFLC